LGVTTKPEKTGEAMYYTDDGSDPSDEKSDRKRVKAGETLYIEGGNRTLKLVACDHKGTYGTIKTIKAIDDSKKYEIKPPRQAALFEKTVTFIFPKDKEGARVTITSLFHGLSTEKIMSIEELKEIVNEILKKMRP